MESIDSIDIFWLAMALMLTLAGLFISYLLFVNDREFQVSSEDEDPVPYDTHSMYQEIEYTEKPYYEAY